MKKNIILLMLILGISINANAKFGFQPPNSEHFQKKTTTNNDIPERFKNNQKIKEKVLKKEKKEDIKITTEFNTVDNLLDYGCISKLADLNNRATRYLDAVYYSTIHEIWRTIPKYKSLQEPTIKNTQNQIKELCNTAMGKNKSFEIILYRQSIKFGMKHERFFEIINYFDKNKNKIK